MSSRLCFLSEPRVLKSGMHPGGQCLRRQVHEKEVLAKRVPSTNRPQWEPKLANTHMSFRFEKNRRILFFGSCFGDRVGPYPEPSLRSRYISNVAPTSKELLMAPNLGEGPPFEQLSIMKFKRCTRGWVCFRFPLEPGNNQSESSLFPHFGFPFKLGKQNFPFWTSPWRHCTSFQIPDR